LLSLAGAHHFIDVSRIRVNIGMIKSRRIGEAGLVACTDADNKLHTGRKF
jgi:hypothetical protein